MNSLVSIEFFGEIYLYKALLIQTLMALILGGVVGYDREKKQKSAGIKTNMLICLGATLYTTMGLLVATQSSFGADPNRIAAQIVSGIGFLGAGAIIQGRGNVTGMTTAATIWVVAAVGYAIGAGFPFSAAFFTFIVLMVLKLLQPVYSFLESKRDYDYFQMQILSRGSVRRTVRGIIMNSELEIDDTIEEDFDVKKGRKILSIFVFSHHRRIQRVAEEIIVAPSKRELQFVLEGLRRRGHSFVKSEKFYVVESLDLEAVVFGVGAPLFVRKMMEFEWEEKGLDRYNAMILVGGAGALHNQIPIGTVGWAFSLL